MRASYSLALFLSLGLVYGSLSLDIVDGEDPNLSTDCMLPFPPSFVAGVQHDDSLAGLEGKLLGRVNLLEGQVTRWSQREERGIERERDKAHKPHDRRGR
jgi:hypothetical protein